MGASKKKVVKQYTEENPKRDTALKVRWNGRAVEVYRSSGMPPACLQGKFTDEATAHKAIESFERNR